MLGHLLASKTLKFAAVKAVAWLVAALVASPLVAEHPVAVSLLGVASAAVDYVLRYLTNQSIFKKVS